MWSKLLLIAILTMQPLCIFAQLQKYKGYPQEKPDIRSEFVNPPKGYGNVPFYWWSGMDCLEGQVRETHRFFLRNGGIFGTGFPVNAHG